MYQEKNILDALKDVKNDIKAIEDILDDPKFGLKEIKKEIRDIEKKLDKEFDKDHDKDDDKKKDKDHKKDHDKDHDKDDKKPKKDWKKNFFCVGNVTVITSNNLIFTGQLSSDGDPDDHFKRDDEVDFLTIRLTAPLLAQPGSGDPAQIQPFYVPGDTVKLNVGQIETIGPSHVFNTVNGPGAVSPSK